jgi:hypothetical protein
MYSRAGQIDASLGAGMYVRSPVRFDIQVAGEYFWHNNVSIGVAIDTLIRDEALFIFRPFARYHFDIDSLPNLVPFIGGGIGAGIDTNSNGVMDILLPNVGFKYAVSETIRLGTEMGLHILTDFDNSRVDFQILFAVISFRF